MGIVPLGLGKTRFCLALTFMCTITFSPNPSEDISAQENPSNPVPFLKC